MRGLWERLGQEPEVQKEAAEAEVKVGEPSSEPKTVAQR